MVNCDIQVKQVESIYKDPKVQEIIELFFLDLYSKGLVEKNLIDIPNQKVLYAVSNSPQRDNRDDRDDRGSGEHDFKVIGFMTYSYIGGDLWLVFCCVEPEYRKKKVATMMLDELKAIGNKLHNDCVIKTMTHLKNVVTQRTLVSSGFTPNYIEFSTKCQRSST